MHHRSRLLGDGSINHGFDRHGGAEPQNSNFGDALQMHGDEHLDDVLHAVHLPSSVTELRYDPSAANLLKGASDKLASHPMVQYHLGRALLKSGDKSSARKRLEIALALDKNFSEAGKAKAILASI